MAGLFSASGMDITCCYQTRRQTISTLHKEAPKLFKSHEFPRQGLYLTRASIRSFTVLAVVSEPPCEIERI